VVHTDRGTAFHEIIEELLQMTGVELSLTMAYSSVENGIVERPNQEVLRNLWLKQEFVVEAINRHKRSTMEFRVRWAGFGENLTRPFSMLTSCTTISGRMQ